MIEFIIWRIQLVLVGWRAEVNWRRRQITYNALWVEGWRYRFVERFSPWVISLGYKRTWIRSIAFRLSFPRWYLRRWFYDTTYKILVRIAPYTGPGRFEGMEPGDALKVEWLDANHEVSTAYAGGGDYPLSQYLFTNLAVPWSRQPEHWIVEYDDQGFIAGKQHESAIDASVMFSGFESQVSSFFAQPGDDDYDPYDHYGTPEHEFMLMQEERGGGW